MKQFSRNHFYIDPWLQERITKSKTVFLGTGLASTIAETMVRTGFCHFFLCDGDVVETSNLNRQNFTQSDVGKKKVLALKERLLLIHPSISCTCLEERMHSLQEIQAELDRADIVINTVDCNPLYYEIIETCRKAKKGMVQKGSKSGNTKRSGTCPLLDSFLENLMF